MKKSLIVQRLYDLYCYESVHYQYQYRIKNPDDPDQKASYAPGKHPLQFKDLRMHIDGKKTICVAGREYHTTFMCFDIDEPDMAKLRCLINRIEKLGIPRDRIYVSTSGNKGYHVDIFFDTPVFKSDLQIFFEYARKDQKVAEIRMECRPVMRTTIKIPLGINFKTNKRCWYLDRETLEPIEDMEYVLQIEQMSGKDFDEIVHQISKANKMEAIRIAKLKLQQQQNRKVSEGRSVPSKNTPVIKEQGQRHILMRKRAVWLRTVGYEYDAILDDLLEWVSNQDQGLITSSYREIERDAASLARYVIDNTPVLAKQKAITHRRQSDIFMSDIKRILCVDNKNARKVAVLVATCSSTYGSCKIAYERIASIIGISCKTAEVAIKLLIASGVIKKTKTGGVVYNNGDPVFSANEYMFVHKKTRSQDSSIEFDIADVIDNFNVFYYDLLAGACDDDMLRKSLTRSELKEVQNARQGDNDGSGRECV